MIPIQCPEAWKRFHQFAACPVCGGKAMRLSETLRLADYRCLACQQDFVMKVTA